MEFEVFEDNKKLVKEFGAKPIHTLKKKPDFYTFTKGLIYSHRDFDAYYEALEKGEACAIVSGVNPSGTFHLGHKVVFDTNLYFQKKYGVHIYMPISDDESYVAGKVKTQEEALKNSIELAREVLAMGFDPKKTHFIIDQVYTSIYNLAFKLSRHVNYSEVKATYGYKPEENIGLHFYPAVQTAHVLYPQILHGIKHVLVPIGPDEDAHLRIARDIAGRAKIPKPAVLHLRFIAGLDGEKMSKSRNNAIYLRDDEKTLKKKCNKALSGGKETVEEHRRLGGNPQTDMAYQYLYSYFLNETEAEEVARRYTAGDLLSGEMKALLYEKLSAYLGDFQRKLEKVTKKDLEKSILKD